MIKNIKNLNVEKHKNYIINDDIGSWTRIMKMSNGFNQGELVVIAARPGCGKTTLALNMAMQATEYGNVLFESLEMSSEELYNRADKFIDISQYKNISLYINDGSGQTCKSIEEDIKKIKPNFVFIDYLQIMNDNIRTTTKRLKALAKKYKCVIILLCQLNRQAETSEPKLSMLRDSGTIEQDADQVWFICEDKIKIAKNRKAKTGSIPIIFVKELSYIKEDESRIKKLEQLYILYKKACNCKTSIGLEYYCNKIKKLDFDFWLKYVKNNNDIDFVFILGGIR